MGGGERAWTYQRATNTRPPPAVHQAGLRSPSCLPPLFYTRLPTIAALLHRAAPAFLFFFYVDVFTHKFFRSFFVDTHNHHLPSQPPLGATTSHLPSHLFSRHRDALPSALNPNLPQLTSFASMAAPRPTSASTVATWP